MEKSYWLSYKIEINSLTLLELMTHTEESIKSMEQNIFYEINYDYLFFKGFVRKMYSRGSFEDTPFFIFVGNYAGKAGMEIYTKMKEPQLTYDDRSNFNIPFIYKLEKILSRALSQKESTWVVIGNYYDQYAYDLKKRKLDEPIIKKDKEKINLNQKKLKTNSIDADALNDRGLKLCGLGRYLEALDCFEEILRVRPDDVYALYGSKMANFQLEKSKKLTSLHRKSENEPYSDENESINIVNSDEKSEESHNLSWSEEFYEFLHSKGLTKTHIQILKKFFFLTNKTISNSEQIRGIKGKEKIPADNFVDEPHYLHNLVRGVYKSEGSEFAQSILTNPNSSWGNEIKNSGENWKISYDFGTDYRVESDITSLKKCYENNIPFGVILRLGKGVNKILGLGMVNEYQNNIFVICPYKITTLSDDPYVLSKKFLEYKFCKMSEFNEQTKYSDTLVIINNNNFILKKYYQKNNKNDIYEFTSDGKSQWILSINFPNSAHFEVYPDGNLIFIYALERDTYFGCISLDGKVIPPNQPKHLRGQILDVKYFSNVLLILDDISKLHCYKLDKNGIRLMWYRSILADDQFDFENDKIRINHDNKIYLIDLDDEHGPLDL